MKTTMKLATSAAVMALLLTGCSTAPDEPQVPSEELTPVEGLPAEFHGTWEVPVMPDYPPYGYTDDAGDLIGVDPEFLETLTSKLGVEADIIGVAFEAQLLGVEQGKYNLMPATNINEDRAKIFDFVSYWKDKYQFLTAVGDTLGDDMSELCGMSIAIMQADVTQPILEEESVETCEGSGQPAINLQTFPKQSDALTALQSGRVEAMVQPISSGAFLMDQQEGFEMSGPTILEPTVTFAVAKDNGLAEFIRDAVNEMIDEGSYMEILEAHGIEDGAIAESEINPEEG